MSVEFSIDHNSYMSCRVSDTGVGVYPYGLGALGLMRLPEDAIGSTTVTFVNVVPGSEIHVYKLDGTELTGVESCVASQQLTWPVYPAPNNVVYVTIIKRGYRWSRFNYSSVLGNESIQLFPQVDLGYSNPV